MSQQIVIAQFSNGPGVGVLTVLHGPVCFVVKEGGVEGEWLETSAVTSTDQLEELRWQQVRARQTLRSIPANPMNGQLPLSSDRVWRDDLVSLRAATIVADAYVPGTPVLILGVPAPHFLEALAQRAAASGTRVNAMWVGSRYTQLQRATHRFAAVLANAVWNDDFVDAPVWESISPYGPAPSRVASFRPSLIIIAMARATPADVFMAQSWLAGLPASTRIVFAGSPWGATVAVADPGLRGLRSAPSGPLRPALPWAQSLQWTGRLAANEVAHPPATAMAQLAPAHICAPQVPIEHLTVLGERVGMVSASAYIAEQGWDAAHVRALADKYEQELAQYASHSGGTGLASIGVSLNVPDFISPHVPNWRAWIAEGTSIGGAFIELGVMTGASGAWFAANTPNCSSHYSLDAAEVWDPISGGEKLAWIQDRSIPVGTLFIGSSSFTLPALGLHLLTTGEYASVIYHDGSHTADDTMVDLEHMFRMLEVGGVLIMDDFIYNPCTGDSDAARAVYAGKRGALAFEKLHAGDLVRLAPVVPTTQIAWKKVRGTVRLIATPAIPFSGPDRDILWCGDHANPQLRDDWFDGHIIVDGESYWDAVENQSLALAGLQAIPRASGQMLGGLLDVGRTIGTNVGGGLENLGEWVGHGHEHDAGAGLGNAIKSGGAAAKFLSEGMGVAANWLFGRK